MMDAQTLAISIIERLGGTTATAELCEVSPGAVSQWKGEKGIPKQQLKLLRALRPDLFEDRRQSGRRSTDKKDPRT